jgi:hydroxymethylglutaryl-CoA lyase
MKVIECPRDAMQGIHAFIPTEKKIQYLNQLLKVGFDTLDFGSFVSPAAIPQMKDTDEVIKGLEFSGNTKLLAIIANERGAERANQYKEINYLGFPLSLSETFQQRNTNKSINEAFTVIRNCQNIISGQGKTMVVYLSMGFGNPYGDPWNTDLTSEFAGKLADTGIKIISLADTVGVASPDSITDLFSTLIPRFPDVEFGAHFHSTPFLVFEKLEAAYNAGCRRFDCAIKGFGGCPMAKDELVGNLPTEKVIEFLKERNNLPELDMQAFKTAMQMALEIFPL